MTKVAYWITLLTASLCSSAQPATRNPTASRQWLATGGIGLIVSPTLVLLSPQLETLTNPNLYLGPLIQAGLGDSALFSLSATGRYLIGKNPKVKPSFEAGLGLAVGSSRFDSSLGINIHFGMGFDYQLEPSLLVGTMIRANLAPPLKTFYLAWPVGMIRMLL